MKDLQASVKRFILRLSLGILLILTVNVFLLGIYIYRHQQSALNELPILPLLSQFSKGLVQKNNHYHLNPAIERELAKQGMWAMLLEDRKGDILWSYRLPPHLPPRYTLSDIAVLSRYYLKDYPVTTWKHQNGLLIVGSAKHSFWKAAYMVPYSEIQAMPGRIVFVLVCDLIALFLLYFLIDRRYIKAVRDVLSGIESLAEGKTFQLKQEGPFSEIAGQLNKTSDLLRTRSIAQENWIAGVSHDVRTPLSYIIGYAEKMETGILPSKDIQEKASIIKSQGLRLKDLISDLNLIVRLGDKTQAIRMDYIHPAAFCREIVASFLNNGLPENYTVGIDITGDSGQVLLKADAHLLQRAINNLLYNCISHNPGGCHIDFRLYPDDSQILFVISDNGKGMSADELGTLQNRCHYLSNTAPSIHGLHGYGLYIVQQIVKMHLGKISFEKNSPAGLTVIIFLPCISENDRYKAIGQEK